MEDGPAAKLQECLLVGEDPGDSRFKLANGKLLAALLIDF